MKRPSKEFEAKNARRHELLDRKFQGTLTEAEAKELEGLKRWVGDYLERRFPRPVQSDAEIDAKFAAIRARIEARLKAVEVQS